MYSEDNRIGRYAEWRELFVAAANADLGLDHAEWSYVSDDYVEVLRMPHADELWERRLADGYFQPIGYKYIEIIFIPTRYRPLPGVGLVREQDADGLVDAPNWTGRTSPFEVDERGSTIYGYR